MKGIRVLISCYRMTVGLYEEIVNDGKVVQKIDGDVKNEKVNGVVESVKGVEVAV